jgi:hypothetical protein
LLLFRWPLLHPTPKTLNRSPKFPLLADDVPAFLPPAALVASKSVVTFKITETNDGKSLQVWIYFTNTSDESSPEFEKLTATTWVDWDGEVMESMPGQVEFTVPICRRDDILAALEQAGYMPAED